MVTPSNGPRILVLDCETMPHLSLHFGTRRVNIRPNNIVSEGRVAGVGFKWLGEKRVQWYADERNYWQDERGTKWKNMVQKTWDALDKADIVVHYNGNSFDMPMLNREFHALHLGPPSTYGNIDLYRQGKKLRMASHKLDALADAFLGERKIETNFDLWLRCYRGEKAAWKEMGRYCQADVSLTETLYKDLLPWINGSPHYGLYSDQEGTVEDTCQRCGSRDLERRGWAYTTMSKFQQYRCRDCGGWSRAKSAVATVDARNARNIS